jgi:hypothetical protein
MRCPNCLQDMTPSPDGMCSLCGKPAGKTIPGRMRLYMITGGLFLASLVYALLVLIMEQTGAQKAQHPVPAQLLQVLPPVFLAVAAIGFGTGQWAAGRATSAKPVTAALIEGAAAEVPVILGLLLYFMFRTVPWFAIFMGVSWLFFVYLSFKIPGYAALLDAMDAQAAAQAASVDDGGGMG